MDRRKKSVAVEFPIPSAEDDFRTYERVRAGLRGAYLVLEEQRRKYGSVGFSTANTVSDLTKAAIDWSVRGEPETAAHYTAEAERLVRELNEQRLPEETAFHLASGLDAALPDNENRFQKTTAQEVVETQLFMLMWPAVKGEAKEMPELPSLKVFGEKFKAPLPAILYGYLDVVSEVGKALDEELEFDMSFERELELFDRFLSFARSTYLALSFLRHFPGYVINNAYGRGNGFGDKLYRIHGLIARISQRYADRLSRARSNNELLDNIKALLEKSRANVA